MAEQNETRRKILDAALKVFSRKGYDGARTDAIAKAAGVNNALIYYYFKGKKDLLDTLVDEFFLECRALMMKGIQTMDLRNRASLNPIFEMFFVFLEEKEDVLRLVVVESLKKDNEYDLLFRFVNAYLGEDEESLAAISERVGVEPDPGMTFDAVRVREFFTLLAPVVFYMLFRGKWERYYGVTKESLRADFLKALYETHVAGHHRPGES